MSDAALCNWIYDEDDDSWEGDCGIKFTLYQGEPKDNEMHYCPKCGSKLVVKEEE